MKKMKSLLWIALIAIILPFTSCSDDDDVVPIAQDIEVTDLAFNDLDPSLNKIEGLLTWKLPLDMTGATKIYIFTSDENGEKIKDLGTVDATATEFAIPAGTERAANLSVRILLDNTLSEKVTSFRLESYTSSVLMLNSGSYKGNNANLALFNLETNTLTADVFKTTNGNELGDTGQDIIRYGSKIYVAVYSSNRLLVLDQTMKLIKEINPKNENNEPLSPRHFAVSNGAVYISYYTGHSVAKLDTASLEIEGSIAVGRYPEGLAVTNGKLYVANSGGLDYPVYGETVSVVDLASFTKEKDITVALNPTNVAVDDQGDVYVISMGNYGSVPNTLQRINVTSGTVEAIGHATNMTTYNNKLYTYYAQWGAPTPEYKTFNMTTEEWEATSYIADPSVMTNAPYAISIDPFGSVYIATSDYKTTGTLFVFDTKGDKSNEFDTNGINPINWIYNIAN